MIFSFLEFCFIGIFLLQTLMLWCLIDISNTLKSQDKEIREWTK